MTRTTLLTRAGRILLGASIIGITVGTAQAQAFVSPLIGYNFSGDSGCPNLRDCEDRQLNIAVSVGALGRVLGTELEVAYSPDFFGELPGLSSNVLTAMGNVMLAPQMGPVRPYALAGIGLMKTHIDLTSASVFTTDNNSLGWNAGGGLMILFGGHVGLRGDLRYYKAFQDITVLGFSLDNTTLDFARAGVGLVLTF